MPNLVIGPPRSPQPGAFLFVDIHQGLCQAPHELPSYLVFLPLKEPVYNGLFLVSQYRVYVGPQFRWNSGRFLGYSCHRLMRKLRLAHAGNNSLSSCLNGSVIIKLVSPILTCDVPLRYSSISIFLPVFESFSWAETQ